MFFPSSCRRVRLKWHSQQSHCQNEVSNEMSEVRWWNHAK